MWFTILVLGLICRCAPAYGDSHHHHHTHQITTQPLFNTIDKDGNGQIGLDELKQLFMGFDSWPEDGQVSEHEFIDGWKANHLLTGFSNGENAALFFFHADRDHDFEIRADDVQKMFTLFNSDSRDGLSNAEFDYAWKAYFL